MLQDSSAQEERSYVNMTHRLGYTTELDDGFEKMFAGDEFKGQLYPHQMTMLKTMWDLYNKRYIKVQDTVGSYNDVTSSPLVAQSNTVVLADPFGSGKTPTICAFICLVLKAPRAVPEHINRTVIADNSVLHTGYSMKGFVTEVTRRFHQVNRPALVIVGSSVLTQWQTAVKQFTSLKVFTIGKVNHMETFYKKFKTGEINLYDIVLLKNGQITKNFLLDGESAVNVKWIRHMIDVVGKITGDSCWSLVVIDDFDSIKIDPRTRNINALYTVYVSATKREDYQKPRIIKYKSIEDMLADRSTVPLCQVMSDSVLFTNFRLRNSDEYINKSVNLTIVNKYKYIYSNPNDNYMRLLGAMGEVDADEIMEMLNGDAIETAAGRLGIKTNSIADIFQRVLDKKYEKYLHDQYIVDAIAAARVHIGGLEAHPRENHTAQELEAIRDKLVKRTPPDFIKYTSECLVRYLKELEEDYIRSRDANAIAVNRVKDNLKQGECQVCTLPLEDVGVVINKCCGIVLCSDCCVKASNIRKQENYSSKTIIITGKCPNCHAIIDVTRDIIFINKDFDIRKIMDAKGDEKPDCQLEGGQADSSAAGDNPDDKKNSFESVKNPKLKALLKIIHGEMPENCSKTELRIKNLIKGTRDVPAGKDTVRKVLVFANYDESLQNIENILSEHKIEFLRLTGTYSQMHSIVEEFRKRVTVLLVNSSQICAGLNLQFATDLVFFHKLLNEHVEQQVVGRAQRIGRTCNLSIHYLLYNNERVMM